MNLKKLFRIKKTKYGIFLEPRYNIRNIDRTERKLKKRRK